MEPQETELQQQLEPDLIVEQEQPSDISYSHKRKIFQDPETLELQIFDDNGDGPPQKYLALDDDNDNYFTDNEIDLNNSNNINNGNLKKEHQGPIACHLPPHCQRHPTEFPSITAFEIHYSSHHRFICSECQAVFPTKRWLDMHLTEFHDVLAQIRKENGQKIHQCYVQGCQKFFSAPKMRKLHLIDKHHYPNTFDFGIVKFGHLPFNVRIAEEAKRKKKRQNEMKNKNENPTAEPIITIASTSTPASSASVEIPIRNHNKNEDTDKDVEMLTESMAKLTIPTTIKFGRDQMRTRLPFAEQQLQGRVIPQDTKASKPKFMSSYQPLQPAIITQRIQTDDRVDSLKQEDFEESKIHAVPVDDLLKLNKNNKQHQRQQLVAEQKLHDNDIQDDNDNNDEEDGNGDEKLDYHTFAIKVDLIEAELHYRLNTRTIKADFREEKEEGQVVKKSNLSFMFQFHTCHISLFLNAMKNEVRIPMTEVTGFVLVDGRVISVRMLPNFQCSYYYHPTTFHCPNSSRMPEDPTGGLMNGTLSFQLKPCEYEGSIKLSIVEMAINKIWYEQHKIKNEPLDLDDVNEKIYVTCVTPISQRILLFPKDGSLRDFISSVQSRLSITPSVIQYRITGNGNTCNQHVVQSEDQWVEAKRQAVNAHNFVIPRLRVQLD
ncbi:275_t:CDS:2 [Ambispora gerdemannii]|uniref:275_t:CDS:1 n=1 Tax=Ambispora gerdemannii TaxID=144530 RepID=A0A9N9BB43_9GLOM|nr:275_t:CDS:2 [Ambispora gerdemannii]